MTPLSTKLKELRTVAEKATPGPWQGFENGPWGGQGFGVSIGGIENVQEWMTTKPGAKTNNVQFISAFNPEVALKLIDALEEAVTFVEKMSKGNRYPSTLKAAENTLSRINSLFTESGDGGAG